MKKAAAYFPINPSKRFPDSFLSRHYRLIVSVIAAVQAGMAIVIGFRRKMWIDELYTLLIANQESVREIIKATVEGCDAAPPMYAALVHFLLPLIPAAEVAVRLPATIGYCATILLTAAFFRRIFSASYALTAVLLTCWCTFEWACEGRAYGLVLGFAACALYMWSIMAENRSSAWLHLFFPLCAAIMTALHFHAISFFGPLFLADLCRIRSGGRVNWKIWASTAAVIAVVLGMHTPVFMTYRKFQPHCWAKAHWKYFPVNLPLNMKVKYVYESVIVLFAAAVALNGSRFVKTARNLLDEYLWVAFLLYFLSPAAIFALSMFTTQVFLSRYTAWMFIGAAGFIVGIFALTVKSNERIGAVAAVFLLAVFMWEPVQRAVEKPRLVGTDDALKEASALPHDRLPIVVADHHFFMELSYYAPQPIRDRLVYPLNRDMDLKYLGYDTGALLMDAIRKRFHLAIVDYKEILESYDRFYVISAPEHYLPSLLKQHGRHLKLLQSDEFSSSYLVWADIEG